MGDNPKQDPEKLKHQIAVGNKIRRLIKLRPGCTQEEVAHIAGYKGGSNSMVNQQIKGRKMMPAQRLIKIANYFNIPPGYLIDNKDYSKRDLALLIAIHSMIDNKDGHPLYEATCKLHDV